MIDIRENYVMFIMDSFGTLANTALNEIKGYTKLFGRDDIYVDVYGAIIFKKAGMYRVSITTTLNKSFSMNDISLLLRRFNNDTGVSDVIATTYSPAVNNPNTNCIDVLVPVTAYEYLKIFARGIATEIRVSINQIS